MKRLLSLLLIIAMLMFTLTACVPTPEEESETPTSTTKPTRTETDDMEDYTVSYENLCVDIGLNEDGNKAIDELSEIAEALKAAGLTDYAERIDAIVQIIVNSGSYTQAST